MGMMTDIAQAGAAIIFTRERDCPPSGFQTISTSKTFPLRICWELWEIRIRGEDLVLVLAVAVGAEEAAAVMRGAAEEVPAGEVGMSAIFLSDSRTVLRPQIQLG